MLGGKKKSPRNSGIELLRIIAMLMIVAHHFSVHTIWPNSGYGFVFNEYWKDILASFGKVGVGIFFIITGYFFARKSDFNIKKIFNIIRPVWFYSWLFLILAISCRIFTVKFSYPLQKELVESVAPIIGNAYWFVTSYVIVLLLSPYLKKMFDSLGDKELLSVVFVLAIAGFGTGFFLFISTSIYEPAMTVPCGIFYALIGYTIKRYEDKISGAWSVVCALVSTFILFLTPIIFYYIKPQPGQYIQKNIFWGDQSVICMALAASLFVIFSRLKFHNNLVNYLASLMFGVYLIHDNIFVRQWLWRGSGILQTASHYGDSKIHFIFYSLGVILLVFAVSILIEAVRKLSVKAISRVCTIGKR